MNLKFRIKSYLKFLLKAKPLIGHGIHSPFVYRLASETLFKARKNKTLLKEVEDIRRNLKKNDNTLIINDLGTGRKDAPYSKKISTIARTGISSSRQCRMLNALANEFNPKTIIELGTSLGLSTSSLALGAKDAKIFTVEGSEEIAKVAQENFAKQGITNITSITGNFDTELPKLLANIQHPVMIYIDGNHSYDATLRYFNMILPYTNESSILIFDDIHWSEGMEKAWDAISQHPKVVFSVDLYNVGLVFYNKGVPKQHFLIRY